MAKAKKSYQVQAVVKVLVSVEISAATVEEAVTKVKELPMSDFIEILSNDEHIDFEVTGVYATESF